VIFNRFVKIVKRNLLYTAKSDSKGAAIKPVPSSSKVVQGNYKNILYFVNFQKIVSKRKDEVIMQTLKFCKKSPNFSGKSEFAKLLLFFSIVL